MAALEWQWRDTGSAFGHMQAVASNGSYNRMQTAYRAFLDHSSTCGDCLERGGRCPAADELWRAYKSARDDVP
jgi:hypothetical protein